MKAARPLWFFPAIVCLASLSAVAQAENTAGTLKPGSHELSFQHGGLERTYLLHIPPQHDGTKLLPLVMFFHGGMGTAKHAEGAYGWSEKADKEGFLVVYGNGTGRFQTWNAMHGCGSAFKNNVDDIGYVKTLLQELTTKINVDTRRIYATGMSNGAMLTHRLAAEMSDVFAAAAPVAGSIGGKENAGATEKQIPEPKNPVPMMIIHGKEDKNVRYEGGETSAGVEKGRIDLSVADAAAFWKKANRCTDAPKKETSKDGLIIQELYPSEAGADVLLVTIMDGGHAWPGSKKARRFLGGSASDFSATDAAWEFFKKHTKTRDTKN
ncbi:MAG TPA: PHB depolymerase family esterase [Planctomycetota bacterium]|nr:PHB depolymerase family esterase [Planctomycetota bacterium]